jgi:hypothetical protein
MRKLYQVDTGNAHNQTLIFTTKAKAISWLVKVMRNDFLGQAIQDIKELELSYQGFYNVYPKQQGKR